MRAAPLKSNLNISTDSPPLWSWMEQNEEEEEVEEGVLIFRHNCVILFRSPFCPESNVCIECSSTNMYVVLYALCTRHTANQIARKRDTKSQESSVVESINQHENKQSYNLKKLLMKAINKAFYKSAVHTHTHAHTNDKVHDQHVFHTKCQSDCCLHTANHSISFLLCFSHLLSLSLFGGSFHPHDGHRHKLSTVSPHTRYFFLSFSQKGSDCYYSYIQITYILMLLLLLLLCMTKIQSDAMHTRTAYVYKTTGVEILWQRRYKLSTK